MKKMGFLLWIFCLFPLAMLFPLEGVRDIATVDTYFYSDDTYIIKVEEVLLVPLGESLYSNTKFTTQITGYWQRYLLQTGIVYVWSDGLYTDAIYGVATDQDFILSHEGYCETTYETEVYIFSARLKMGFYPHDDIYFLAPDTSALYFFNDLYALKAKYFFGYDSLDNIDHTMQIENRFKWTESLSTDLITTGSYHTDPDESYWPYEVGVKVNYTIKDGISLRYLCNYLKPDDDTWGLENSLTLDVKF
jgi:hypothetical protein